MVRLPIYAFAGTIAEHTYVYSSLWLPSPEEHRSAQQASIAPPKHDAGTYVLGSSSACATRSIYIRLSRSTLYVYSLVFEFGFFFRARLCATLFYTFGFRVRFSRSTCATLFYDIPEFQNIHSTRNQYTCFVPSRFQSTALRITERGSARHPSCARSILINAATISTEGGRSIHGYTWLKSHWI